MLYKIGEVYRNFIKKQVQRAMDDGVKNININDMWYVPPTPKPKVKKKSVICCFTCSNGHHWLDGYHISITTSVCPICSEYSNTIKCKRVWSHED